MIQNFNFLQKITKREITRSEMSKTTTDSPNSQIQKISKIYLCFKKTNPIKIS
jgi:hypothetical protein